MTTTTSRLLHLLSLLQARRDWPGSLLAERLQVSDRTVRRDIDRLRELGYHIHTAMGPDGGYRLGAGSELPPLLFDDDQTVAVAIALQTAPAAGVRIEEGALRALATIRQVMPSRLRHRLDALDVTAITGRAGSGTPARVSADVLVSLATTVRAREVLRFDYAVRGAEPDEESSSPPRAWSRTTSSRPRGGGTSSPGTSTARTGASSASTGSRPAPPPARASRRETCRAAMCTSS